MVATDPKVAHKRRRWELFIWALDLAAYGFVVYAGWAALFATSEYIQREVTDQRAILLWGWLLFGGGILGLLGRAVRLWALELPGNVAAASGAAIYAYIIAAAVANGSSHVLLAFVLIALTVLLRRYAELQIFTSEPGIETWKAKVTSLLRRRTELVVRRQHF